MRRLGEEAERLNADFYVADLKEAGFEIRVAVPISELAEAHLTKNYNQKVESGKEASPWLRRSGLCAKPPSMSRFSTNERSLYSEL